MQFAAYAYTKQVRKRLGCSVTKSPRTRRQTVVQKNFRRITVWVLAFAAVGASLLVPAHVWAQVAGGTLSGTVTDATGSVIPNAKLSIANIATRVTRSVTTDTAGFYSVPNLLPG